MRYVPPPLRLIAVILFAACARPVLYYPTPAGNRASKPAATKTTPTPAESTETPLLMSVSGSAAADIAYLRSRIMMMPVAGASMRRVEDTFSEPRDGGRVHRAIDILAPRGTPVLSADDGQVLRMTTSGLGGIAIFAKDANGRMVYYYAHMDRFHSAMVEGRDLSKGDTIGFVGTTGNAPKNTPHLHFQVMRMPADGRYWDGEAINPYGLLIDSEKAARSATQP